MKIEIVQGEPTPVSEFFSSQTPETDAMALSDSRTDHNWRQLCRKLERERDEARKLAQQYRSLYYTQLGINGTASWFPWEVGK